MIVFLTLVYIGLLALLVKAGVIKPTLWWKLSPVLWMVLLLFVLFIPIQWGAPTGAVNVYRPVIEIVPNVSGEVIEVAARGSKLLKKGDILFRIDPEPYQAEVDRLVAALEQARSNAEMLPVDVRSSRAAVASADARVVEARQREETLRYGLEVAAAAVANANAQLELARATLRRDEEVARRSPDAITEQELDVSRAAVKTATAAIRSASAQEEQARVEYESQIDGVNTLVVRATEDRKAANAALEKAELALGSTINGVNTQVAQLEAQLTRARYDLEQTTVVAPADGYAVGLTLRPGQRVAAFPMRSWIAFVEASNAELVVGVNQYVLRHVEPGHEAEVTLNYLPGKTFAGVVDRVVSITPEGQLQPTGSIADAPSRSTSTLPLGVVVRIDEPGLPMSELPGGATGTGAIYTNSMKPTHVIRKVMIRMQSFINYLVP